MMQSVLLLFNVLVLIASGTAQETNGCPTIPCDIVCTNGFQLDDDGCELCSCIPCPPVRCAIFCENGFKIGANNCSTCECNDVEMCQELTCDQSCPLFGHRVGADGCMMCECNENPCNCDSDEVCVINSKLEWNCVKNPGENEKCNIDEEDRKEKSGSKSKSGSGSDSKCTGTHRQSGTGTHGQSGTGTHRQSGTGTHWQSGTGTHKHTGTGTHQQSGTSTHKHSGTGTHHYNGTHRHTGTGTHKHTGTGTHRHSRTGTHKHSGTGTHSYNGTHRHTGTGTHHKHTGTGTHGHTGTGTHRHTGTGTHRHTGTGTGTHRHTGTGTHRHTGTGTYKHTGTGTHGHCGRNSLPEKLRNLLSSSSERDEEVAEGQRIQTINNGATLRDMFQSVKTVPDSCQDGLYCKRVTDEYGICSAIPRNGSCYASSGNPDEECDTNGYYKLHICFEIAGSGNKECVCVQPENGTRYEDTRVVVSNSEDSNLNCINIVYGTCSVIYDGLGYSVKHGGDYFDHVNCRRCRCFYGQLYCDNSLTICKDSNGTQTSSSCTLDSGVSIPHGSSYTLDCNRCFCVNGKFVCSEFSCGVSESTCNKCSLDTFSKVCGPDGRTYPNLCTAVECAGWDPMEVLNGSCSSHDPCVQYPCEGGEICFRRGGVSCLSEFGCVPNELRVCCLQCDFNSTFLPYKRDPADNGIIGTGDIDPTDTAVCGSDGRSYLAICHLIPNHATVHILHAGTCDNVNCRGGMVCGTDAESYANICALKTFSANARMDYPGGCLDSDTYDSYEEYCRSVVDQGLCQYSASNCEYLVQPAVGCCPICGASVVFVVNGDVLQIAAGIASSLSTLDTLMASLLPSDLFLAVTKRCKLESTLTARGNIETIFSSHQPEDQRYCVLQASAIVQELNLANVIATTKRETGAVRPSAFQFILGAALAPNTTTTDASTGGSSMQTSVAASLLYIVVTTTIFIMHLFL